MRPTRGSSWEIILFNRLLILPRREISAWSTPCLLPLGRPTSSSPQWLICMQNDQNGPDIRQDAPCCPAVPEPSARQDRIPCIAILFSSKNFFSVPWFVLGFSIYLLCISLISLKISNCAYTTSANFTGFAVGRQRKIYSILFQEEGKMLDQCEMLGKCGFFTNFKGNSEVIKQGWVKTYCENHIKSSKCERKKIRAQTGKPPADHMAPTGKLH